MRAAKKITAKQREPDASGADLVNTERLAAVLKVTPRTIQLWARDRGLPRANRGRYPLVECIHWRLTDLEKQIDGADQGENDERKRLIRAQAQRHELAAQQMRGELVDSESMRGVLNNVFSIVASQLEGLAPRLTVEPAEQQRITVETRAIRSAVYAAIVNYAADLRSGGDIDPTSEP